MHSFHLNRNRGKTKKTFCRKNIPNSSIKESEAHVVVGTAFRSALVLLLLLGGFRRGGFRFRRSRGAATAPPDGTDPNLARPASITSEMVLPSRALTTSSARSASQSTPPASKIFWIAAAEGADPPIEARR